MINVAIIIGSARPGRNGEAIADWVYDLAVKRGDARFELADLADFAPGGRAPPGRSAPRRGRRPGPPAAWPDPHASCGTR